MPGTRGNNKQGAASRAIENQFNQSFKSDNKSEPGPDKPKNGAATKTFTLLVDKVPYEVKIQPFDFNDEKRCYVNVNAGAYHVFTWDTEVMGWRAIDDDSADLPEVVEEAISKKLQAQ
jgi:hypothetical protein